MKDKAERSTHKTNVYMGVGGGYTWPWFSSEHNRKKTNWDLKPLLLQPLFSCILSISYSVSIEQRGSLGCLDFCECFTHLVVVYHLDRMLHRGFFSPPYGLKGKWLRVPHIWYMNIHPILFILRSNPKFIGNRENWHFSETALPSKMKLKIT